MQEVEPGIECEKGFLPFSYLSKELIAGRKVMLLRGGERLPINDLKFNLNSPCEVCLASGWTALRSTDSLAYSKFVDVWPRGSYSTR